MPHQTGLTINTLRPRQNGRQFVDDIVKDICVNENIFLRRFHWSLFLRIQLKYSSIDLDNGLVLARWQAIIWTNNDAWWRHQMETFSVLLAISEGNSPVPGEFPTQWPVTRSFDIFFDMRLNKRLSKQWWGWWFETLSRPLWRHYNVKLPLTKHPAVTVCKLETYVYHK